MHVGGICLAEQRAAQPVPHLSTLPHVEYALPFLSPSPTPTLRTHRSHTSPQLCVTGDGQDDEVDDDDDGPLVSLVLSLSISQAVNVWIYSLTIVQIRASSSLERSMAAPGSAPLPPLCCVGFGGAVLMGFSELTPSPTHPREDRLTGLEETLTKSSLMNNSPLPRM